MTARNVMGENECTVTRRVANKESSGRNKRMTKKMKRKKNDVAEEIYHDELIFGNDALTYKNKAINKEIEKMFVTDSVSTSHMVNSLKI